MTRDQAHAASSDRPRLPGHLGLGAAAAVAAAAAIAAIAPAGVAARQQAAPGRATLTSARTPTRERYVSVPIVKQALRNNCETAALSMLLAARGVRVPQLELQRELPRDGPLDPLTAAGDSLPIWGDPDRGFVGRVRGGGTSGGYGVYPQPIRALAHRHRVLLTPLTGQPAATIYRWLRAGRPVMVWVGLSNGPYKTWRTPLGKRITANFGEHTVVLTGLRGRLLRVNDPLDGQRKLWSRSYFEAIWRRLGRRALGT